MPFGQCQRIQNATPVHVGRRSSCLASGWGGMRNGYPILPNNSGAATLVGKQTVVES